MEYLVTTPKGTYRIEPSSLEVEDLMAILDDLADRKAISGPGPLKVLSRQQVLARLGRPTLPDDEDNPFPAPDVIVGEEDSGGAYTRGWLDWRVAAWQDQKMAAKARALAGDEDPAAQQDVSGEAAPPAASGEAAATRSWAKGSRQWEAPGSADERVVLVTSRGIVTPSGWVLTGPLPSAQNVPRFVTWHWRKKPRALPQMWFTAEAMESIGMPVEDANPSQVAEIVEQTFGCRVTWHQSGFFTCQWGSGGETAPADGGDAEGVATPPTRRSVQLVFVPWLPLDPSDARPGDLGVAGIENTDTELPEDEDQAVPILAERIAWLAESLGDGIGPASRWSTVGAAFADVVSRRSTIKGVKGCPLPGEVLAAQSDLDPDLHEGKRPHKARGEYVKVETDQRAAYLASVTKLSFGYGEPTRVDHPDPDVFNTQNPPFALWRLTTPAGGDIDGLSKRLPLPHGYMDWEEPRTFWATTPAVRHLISPVDNGGAGLSPAELAIDAAWVWPHQSRQLLRSWGEEIRLLLKEAITEGRTDRENMLKAMYKAYLGRMKSPKWSPQQYHHHQPAWYAAIQADTRARAMTFAVRIAQTHGLYPVAADVDAWMYWVAPDVDITVLAEPEEHNGRYRIKAVEYPPSTKPASDKGGRS